MVELKSKTEQLIKATSEAITRANAVARSSDPGEKCDGGSCNFDTAIIRLPGIRRKTVEAIIRATGVDMTPIRNGLGEWMVHTVANGQGMRRTLMVEAAARSLKESGMDSCVKYITD